MANNNTQLADSENPDRIASLLRTERMAAKNNKEEESGKEQENIREIQKTPADLRSAVMAKKRKEMLKKKGTGMIKEKADQAVKTPTKVLLRGAWLSLVPSWFLTLLYIDAHFICRAIPALKVFFCPIGSEWVPTAVLRGTGGDARAKTYPFFLLDWGLFIISNFIVLVAFLLLYIVILALVEVVSWFSFLF